MVLAWHMELIGRGIGDTIPNYWTGKAGNAEQSRQAATGKEMRNCFWTRRYVRVCLDGLIGKELVTELKIIQQGKLVNRPATGKGTRNCRWMWCFHNTTIPWCHSATVPQYHGTTVTCMELLSSQVVRRIEQDDGANWEERWQLHGKAVMWLQSREEGLTTWTEAFWSGSSIAD